MGLTIRAIQAEELDLYASIPDGVVNHALKDHIVAQWESGESRPEWCFILEDESSYLGRAAFWCYPALPLDLNLGAWYVDWDDSRDHGLILLEGCFDALRMMGVRSIEARLFSDRTTQLEERHRILLGAGFTLLQDKNRFSIEFGTGISGSSFEPQRLTFENPRSELVSEFLPLIEAVMTNSLDRADLIEVGMTGSSEAAELRLRTLLEIDPDPNGWLVAHNERSEVIGFVIAQRFNTGIGVINYIGVLPEFRGRGYSRDLVRGALTNLEKRGFTGVLAETDVENAPMLQALTDCNFKARSTTRVLIKWLN